MSKEVKQKPNTFDTIKALYYSGKVKPALNRIVIELENDPENLEFILLACRCLLRGKNFTELSSYADTAIRLNSKHAEGYYYKGIVLHHKKGKEQEALKNFNEALTIDPDNTIYLKGKATTHLLLYKDYHLPIKFAEKYRDKAEENLLKIVDLIEQKATPSYTEFLTAGDVCMMLSKALDAKRYYVRAVSSYESSDESLQDKNIYKDIIKAQKACIKLLEKFTE